MLKERTTQHSKGLARKYTKVFSGVIFFLLSPNLYFHIFFNGHVPYYLHPHRHAGIVYILPKNQKETTPSQTWRKCLHYSCESKGNNALCRVCAAIVPGPPTSFSYFNTKTEGWKHVRQILPYLPFSNLFFPHNSFNVPNLKKFPLLSPPLDLRHFPLYSCSVETMPRHASLRALLPQVPGPPSTRQRGKGLWRQHCCSAVQVRGGNESSLGNSEPWRKRGDV